jgi:hypothetical protein
LDFRREQSDPNVVRRVPVTTGPLSLATKVQASMQLGPCRVSTRSTVPASPSAGVQLPEVFGPSNGIHQISPLVSRAVPLSTRFRSQAFSASQRLPSLSGFCGSVSRRNRFWDPPSEFSPRENRDPSRGHLAPLQLSTRLPWRPLEPYHPRFHRRPRSHAVAWYPPTAMDSLSPDPKAKFPVALDSKVDPPFSASFTCSEALILSRIRSQSTRVAPRRRSLLSWVFPL